jgi:hypothetical protein
MNRTLELWLILGDNIDGGHRALWSDGDNGLTDHGPQILDGS